MSTHRTVLVVADFDQNAHNYAHQLQQDRSFTYQVLIKQYGNQLLTPSQSQKIDGILLELQSPHSGSFEVIKLLKAQMGNFCPPIIVIDSGDAEVAVQALKNGAADYLVRDRVSPGGLRLAMRNAIEKAELRWELQQSQERFHASIENMLDCFGIFSSIRDASGRILDFQIDYLNAAACQNNRMAKESQIGRGLCEILPAHRESGLFDEYCHLVETGEPLIKDALSYSDTYGDRRLIRAFDIRATKLNDGFVASWRDITDRKQMELEFGQTIAALQISQQRYRDLAEAMPQIVWTADAKGMVNYWNQRWYEYTGLDQTALMGLTGVSTIHPEDHDRALEQWSQAVTKGDAFEIEYRIQRWDGLYHWFICRGLPTRNDQQQIIGWIGTITDIDDRKQAEALLQKSQAQLQEQLAEIEAIYQSAPIGLNVLDADLRFVRINQRLAEINGLPMEAHIGHTVKELLPDLADTAEQLLRSILETGEPRLNVEVHGETPARPGVKRTWLEHFLPLKDGDRVIGISTVCEEITERLQIEKALRQSEERFRNMADNAPVMVWVTDQTGAYTYLSKSWYHFTGQNEAARLAFSWLEALHPEDREPSRTIFLQASERQEAFRLEYRLRRQDGEYRWAIDAASPWFGEEGEFKGYIGSVIDISDRKQIEEALRFSEERYRTLFKSIDQGFCVIEVLFDDHSRPIDYRFLETNPAFELQTGLSNAQGKRVRELVPNHEDYWFEVYGNIALTGEPNRVENRSEALQRWYDLYAFRIGEPDSRKVAVLFNDITNRKQAEIERHHLLLQEQSARAAAERANRIKDEFLAVLSHELRSPLNPILGWSKLLQTRKLDQVRTAEALASIERNARLQTQLIDDLLDVAKILRGKLSLNITAVNLAVVIDLAIDTVKTAAMAKSITLHSRLPNLGQVLGDAARLQQVIWNLLSNAIKFTPCGGRVEIRMEQVGHQAEIQVQDTGRGINPDFLPYIFESFRQEDASITRQYGGLGLGLAIVNQLVDAHGGTITADSPGEDLGATFTIRLPLLNAEPEIKQSSIFRDLELDLTGIRVLAVDDDPDARELLTALLTQYGATVLTVASAAEVLIHLEAFQPDVLVSDIGMPEVDGYTLIQWVRALPLPQHRQIPAIALTAYARNDDHQRAINSGYQQHVTKPLEPEQLVQAVISVVQRH